MELEVSNALQRAAETASLASLETAAGPQSAAAEKENIPLSLPKNDNRKPVKFKVRKVSHEPISPDSMEFTVTQQELDSGGKQVRLMQQKYDAYVSKIEKINKEINFLQDLLPPNNVDIDYHTRNKITRAIERLNVKIDEISKKKYALGITLSRLWREHETGDIWVRSVSNA